MTKPIDRTLAAMWETYAQAVIPPGESAAAIRNNLLRDTARQIEERGPDA